MDIRSTVGTNIRKLRQAKKMSQEELAFDAGVDRSYLSEVESGQKNVGIAVLEKIAKALDVDISVIVGKLEKLNRKLVYGVLLGVSYQSSCQLII